MVGRLTFQSLYDAALALDASGPVVRTVSLPAPDAALRPGDTGAEVLRLNRMLLFLSQWIPEINFTAGGTPGSTFDPELEIAVRSAQRYFGLDETGVVTADDWAVFRQAALDLLAASPAGASPKPGRRMARRGAGAGQLRPCRFTGAAVAQCSGLRRPDRRFCTRERPV